ncbi:MAG: cation transporter [Eubacterium sp.]|nr:cation transporter [Eubacterium sp.]
MGKTGIKTAIFGFAMNFALFLIKLYVSISSGSLAIYCDGINNLGDSLSCIIALAGFILAVKLNEMKSNRAQALASFVIGLILAVTGAYFAYNGLERLMYPVQISYLKSYAVLIAVTALVKLIMGIVYIYVNKKHPSPVYKTLIMDSFLDTAITISTLLSLTLSVKINFAIDSILSIVIGIIVAVSAVKTIVSQSKYLINN